MTLTRASTLKLVCALVSIAGSATAAPYCNARYGYCITVPPALYGQGESDSGDGQVFLNRPATVTLTVWGGWSDIPDLPSFTDSFKETSRGWPAGNGQAARVVTYKLLKPDFFVVSGVQGGKVFYQRTIRKGGVTATYLLEYRDGDRVAQGYIKSLSTGLKVSR